MKIRPTRLFPLAWRSAAAGLFLAVTLSAQTPPSDGRYRLKNRASGLVLDNAGSDTNGTSVKQETLTNTNNQRWGVSASGGYWKLRCVTGAKYLDSVNLGATNGDPVGQWSATASANQQWTLQDAGDGYWRVVNRANGKALDTGGQTTPGAILQFWTVGSSQNQQWQFVREFVHPGVSHDQADLNRMKNNIGVEPYLTAYNAFKATKWAQSTWVAHPVQDETYGVGQFQIRDDSLAAYYNAVMWYVTGNTAHLTTAKTIINAWVTTMQTFDVTDHLSAAPAAINFSNAAEIIRYNGGGWTAADISALENWLTSKLLPPLLTPGGSFAADSLEGANHGSTQIYGLIAMGVFCNRQDIFDFAVNSYNKNSGGTTYGVQQYIHTSGQNYESYRDHGHAVGGFGNYPTIAEIAWKQGVDLYAVGGNRLLAGAEHVATFNMMSDVTPVTWTAQDGLVRNSVTSLARGPRDSGAFLLAYNHYVNRKGLTMPNTKLLVDWFYPWQGAGEYFLRMVNTSGVKPTRPSTWGEPAPTSAVLFGDGGYGGNFRATFGVGSFNNAALLAAGGRDNSASSIKVPRGWKVTLYDGPNLDGSSVVVTSTEDFLGRTGLAFNDRVSSLKVENTGGDASVDVTFYDDINFAGASSTRGPGWYDVGAIGLPDNTISSIKIPTGYIVIFWDAAGFPTVNALGMAGLQASVADLGANSNKISSLLIIKNF